MMKILVIHSWGMGDLILATPMLKSLAKNGYEVDLAVFGGFAKVILKNNDFIKSIYELSSFFDFVKFFKKYDYLVSTAGTNPFKIKILGKFLGVKNVFAMKQERNVHRIDMNLKIVNPLLKIIEKEPYIYVNGCKKYIDDKKKNIGFAVGSGVKQKFKRWDKEKYKKLIEKMDGNKLVFLGKDESDLEKFFKNLDVTIVKENLEDVIGIISNLDLLIGNDNGLMHIGYATKINTVTIFGMTNEKETGGYRKNNESIFLDIKCRPCFDPSTDKLKCNTYECLKNLESERVWKVCQKYL
jgi:heptosyltransferase-2